MLQVPLGAKYRAFISYSRSDGGFVADLHRRLEHYVLPSAMRQGPDGESRPRRPVNPVFRDKGELVPGGSLPQRLKSAVDDSEYLVLVCSPAAARRDWVDKELRYFLSSRSIDRLVCIVTAGVPGSSRSGNSADECFPPALLEHSATTGQEPLWLDATRARRISQTNLVRTVAALCGLRSADELLRRDEARRKMQIASAAAAIAAFIAVFLGALWLSNRTAALRQADDLERLAQAAGDAGYHDRAARFLLTSVALRRKYLADEITPLGEALMRRTIAMARLRFSFSGNSPDMTFWSWRDGSNVIEFSTPSHLYRFDIQHDRLAELPLPVRAEQQDSYPDYPLQERSPDGTIYAGASAGSVLMKDMRTGEVHSLSIPAQWVTFSRTGKYLEANGGKLSTGWDIWVIEPHTRKVVLHVALPLKNEQPHVVGQPSSDVPAPRFSSDEQSIAMCGIADCVSWDIEGRRQPFRFHRETQDRTIPTISPSGDMIAMEEGQTVRIVDFRTGTELMKVLVGNVGGFDFSPDEKRFVATDTLGMLSLWDINRRVELAALPQPAVLEPYQVVIDAAGGLLYGNASESKKLYATSITRPRPVQIPADEPDSILATSRPRRIVVNDSKGVRLGDLAGDGHFVVRRFFARAEASLTPRGDYLIVTSGDDEHRRDAILDLDGRILSWGPADEFKAWDVSPDGKRALVDVGQTVALVAMGSHRILWRHAFAGEIDRAAAYWPANRIAVLSSDEKGPAAMLSLFEGVEHWTAKPTWRAQLAYLTFSGDGSIIALTSPALTHFASAPTELWATKDGSSLGAVVAPTGEANADGVALPGDGKFVIAYNNDGTIVWDRAAGIRIAQLISPPYQHQLNLSHGWLLGAGNTGVAVAQRLPDALGQPADQLPAVICRSTLHPLQQKITAEDALYAPVLRSRVGSSVCSL